MASLKKHENDHADINREQAGKLDKSLPGTSGYGIGNTPGEAVKSATKEMNKEIQDKANQINAETRKKQADYDAKTDHGRKQGGT